MLNYVVSVHCEVSMAQDRGVWDNFVPILKGSFWHLFL